MIRLLRQASLAAVPLAAVLALFLLGNSALGQPAKPHAFKGATLYTAAGDQPIANGVLVVDGGKILFAGADDGAWTADNCELHDLNGRVIIPGLVDTHSHIGLCVVMPPATAMRMPGSSGRSASRARFAFSAPLSAPSSS